MKVGDKIRRTIKVYDDASNQTQAVPVEAVIVYIHPERRFYTIECEMPGGRAFRETEYFYPRCGAERS